MVKRARYRNRLLHPLLVVAAIAALDAVVVEDAVLIGFLILGPLLAAVLVGPRETALVGLFATVVALPLGIAHDFFGSQDHLLRAGVVLVGSAVAVLLAAVREEHEISAERLSAEHAAARVLSESASRHDATGRLIEAVGEALSMDLTAMWTLKDDTMRCLDMWQRPGLDAHEFEEASRKAAFARGEALPGRVWHAGGPVWVDNFAEDPNFPRAKFAAAAGLRTGLGFPIRGSTGILGMVELHSSEHMPRDPRLLETLDAVGLRLGQYLERRVAEEAVHQSEARKAAMLSAALDCVITIDHEGHVLEFNPAAERTFGYSREEAEGQELAELIIPPDLRERHREGLVRYLATGEGPLLETRVEVRALHKDGSEFPVEVAITPIRLAGPPMFTGYLRDISDRKRAEADRERVLELERRARAAAEVAERDASFLAEASALLDESLDYDTTLRRLTQLAVPQAGDMCAVDVIDDNGEVHHVGLAHVNAAKLPLAKQVRDRFPAQTSDRQGIGRALRTGESQLLEEVSDDVLRAISRSEEHFELLSRLGIRSAILMPMRTRGRTLGTILLVASEGGRRFDEHDLRLAEELARRAAVAVDNARLYSERSYIARTLQESLLPPLLPDIPGLDTAARYHAAGEGYDVGGDFYDLFPMGENRWAVVIGDVCGKGADAAAVTALARYTLRAAAMQQSAPSSILQTLNTAMLSQRDDRRFCTVIHADLRVGEGFAELDLASGGHPLPLVVSPSGQAREVGRPGTLIGVVESPNVTDERVRLEPGEALVLFTDGVTDVNVPGIPSAGVWLREILGSCAGCTAAEIAERIETAAVEVQGGRLRDDVAILVLRVPPA